MWCVPALDAEYIARMENVLNVLARRYDREAPVVALDERPVVLRGAARPGRPMTPGHVARGDYEYVRHGTANVYCIVEPKAGRHLTHATPNRTAPRFVAALQRIARRYRDVRTIHLVMDNLNLHGPRTLHTGPRPHRGRRPVGTLHAPLHTEARELAQSRRDRGQPVGARVSRGGPRRVCGRSARSHTGLEHPRESRQEDDHLALHLVEGPARLRLYQTKHYVPVEALVAPSW